MFSFYTSQDWFFIDNEITHNTTELHYAEYELLTSGFKKTFSLSWILKKAKYLRFYIFFFFSKFIFRIFSWKNAIVFVGIESIKKSFGLRCLWLNSWMQGYCIFSEKISFAIKAKKNIIMRDNNFIKKDQMNAEERIMFFFLSLYHLKGRSEDFIFKSEDESWVYGFN